MIKILLLVCILLQACYTVVNTCQGLVQTTGKLGQFKPELEDRT